MDKLGFYIIWGCMVYVPFLYTLSTYYLVLHPPQLSWAESSCIMLFGIFSILMNYWVDYQKQTFIEKDGDINIWGSKAKYIETIYTLNGEEKHGKLLISGFWGISRHANYVFELMLSIAWCLPAVKISFVPFLYPIFLFILLVHRTFRDEKKCKEKYGIYWDNYCEIVKWRFIPYIF
jgi:7-dehydrocholesterol reductase